MLPEQNPMYNPDDELLKSDRALHLEMENNNPTAIDDILSENFHRIKNTPSLDMDKLKRILEEKQKELESTNTDPEMIKEILKEEVNKLLNF